VVAPGRRPSANTTALLGSQAGRKVSLPEGRRTRQPGGFVQLPDIEVDFLVDVNISVPAPQCATILTSAYQADPGLQSMSRDDSK
jgi:hypothetical protein